MDVEKHSYVIGGMIWTGIDYLGESMGFPPKGGPARCVHQQSAAAQRISDEKLLDGMNPWYILR